MPDEEIDKIVKEAANQHHPPYDDTAWGKMESLLDKHLPQKKDRKKPIFFLLFFLLLGGAVFFAIDYIDKKQSPTAAGITKDTKAGQTGNPVSSAPITAADGGEAGIPGLEQGISLNQPTAAGAPGDNAKRPQLNNSKPNDAENVQAYADGKKISFDQKGRTAVKIKKPGASGDDETPAKEKETPVGNDVVNSEVVVPEKLKTTNVNDAPSVKKELPKDEIVKTDDEKTVKPEKPAEKNKAATTSKSKTNKSFSDKIGVTLSAGTDVSFVKINNAGQFKPAYGAGLNYDINKHLTVASGFYVSKKIYSASPSDYKFPNGYVYPNLVNIQANCNVYEIPVSVYYNFKAAKNHSWLAAVSLSSLLMKKETYDYQYKTAAGVSYNYVNTIDNENKHYFAVLTLSGGYKYKLNNRFAFVAEPYVKLPLAGIGEGKIKLNSTGLLITAVVKPFAKGKR
jgi:hypothetical protein